MTCCVYENLLYLLMQSWPPFPVIDEITLSFVTEFVVKKWTCFYIVISIKISPFISFFLYTYNELEFMFHDQNVHAKQPIICECKIKLLINLFLLVTVYSSFY